METATNNSALIVGNGFSINFDSDFINIYDRLIDGHKFIIRNANLAFNLDIKSTFKKRIQDNFKAVLQYARFFDEKSFENLFTDAIKFAEFIITNETVLKAFTSHKDFSELTFGHSHSTVITSIYRIGRERGYKFVNIENWTTLVWAYYILEDLKLESVQTFIKEDNSFIKIIKMSQVNKTVILGREQFVLESFICSGFNLYYKFLMASTIFNKGKALIPESLSNFKNINLESLKKYTSQFDILMTLNYDHLLEKVTNRDVIYLHGKFKENEEFYVYHQSHKVSYNGGFINLTDIKLGDFLFVKAMAPIFYNFNAKKFKSNKQVIEPLKEIPRVTKIHNINHFVMFGMNVENDYHILRAIMLGFAEEKIINPQVTYCYFNEDEKESFRVTWNKVITFGNEYNAYVRNIKINYIDSKEIIKNTFNPKG